MLVLYWINRNYPSWMFLVIKIYGACFIISLEEIYLGSIDFVNLTLLFSTAVASIAQFLLIWGAGGLGIIYASLHLNVAPFYVTAIFVVFMGEQWVWRQAFGTALVGMDVPVEQSPN